MKKKLLVLHLHGLVLLLCFVSLWGFTKNNMKDSVVFTQSEACFVAHRHTLGKVRNVPMPPLELLPFAVPGAYRELFFNLYIPFR